MASRPAIPAPPAICLIATARRGPRRLISVVLGTASEDARARDSLNLLNWGYTAFDAVKVYDKGQAISQLKVFKGAQNLVGAGFAEDFVVSVPRGMADKVSAQLVSKQPLVAPIAAGSPVGTLKLTVGGQPWGEYPVVAQSEVPLAGSSAACGTTSAVLPMSARIFLNGRMAGGRSPCSRSWIAASSSATACMK
jgi:D-alanyl-D-alanine carboxypeptidase